MSGVFDEAVEYGPGGHDTSKPNNNVIRSRQVQVPVTEANERQIRDKAKQALADNATFLAIASPTAAQVSAQAKRLTRQNNGLIRLLLRELNSATDT